MLLFVSLFLSVVLQLFAAILSLSLIKRTRYNISWILLSVGFCLMAFQRIYDLFYISQLDELQYREISVLSNWISVFVSFLIFVGTVYIKKLFNYMRRMENLAKENESRIFSAIVKTEEKERQIFAKELHDGLGPILSSVKMAFSALNKEAASEQNKQILTKTNFAIDEAIITVKEISNKLSPHILANFGLERAIKSFVDTISLNKNLVIHCDSDIKNIRYDFNIETVMYRVVCELITNTIKHAQAQHIVIKLRHTEQQLSLLYYDDGIGFDPNNLPHQGMGLSNMESRVKSINGVMNFLHSQKNGTEVSIIVAIV